MFKIQNLKICCLIIFLSFLISGQIIAQDFICGDGLVKQLMEKKYPGYIESVNKTFDEAKLRGKSADRSFDIYTIDVVVHIVYQNEEQNLHDSIIFSQIATLNEDFNRINTDASNVRPIFQDRVGSADIQFRLTDIIRVQTTASFTPDLLDGGLPDHVKITSEGGSNAIDPTARLNLWVCKIEPIVIWGIPLGQVLGYAYPPAGLSHWPEEVSAPSPDLDGVVIDYRIFGRNNPLTIDPGTGQEISGYGRTVVHEVGHYLGLRHIWGDPDIFGGDGCLVDDGVEDTPNQQRSSDWTCNHQQNTCSGDDLPDMIENYMDYSAETCMNSFTLGQIEIMRGVLEGPRIGLIENSVSSKRKESAYAINLYPNPIIGSELHLEIITPVSNGLSIEIYNSMGLKVISMENIMTNVIISTDPLLPGMYYLRLYEKNQPASATIKKIIKY